jgi:hypothetical protein
MTVFRLVLGLFCSVLVDFGRENNHSAASRRRCRNWNSGNGATAGPFKGAPPGANCEPWQGQSQHCSSEFQWTTQPICVQLAERACRCPCSSRQTAIFFSPLRK